MHPLFASRGTSAPIPIWLVTGETWGSLRASLAPAARAFADAAGFEPSPGRYLLLPGAEPLSGVLFALESAFRPDGDRFLAGKLPGLLPAATYRFANAPPEPRLAALAFALGCYRFSRYRTPEAKDIKLELPDGVDGADLSRILEGVFMARDLVNTPANDLGPAELEEAARALAARHGANIRCVVGDDLLSENFPLIHAVGRAAARPPRLIDLQWGEASAPKITLVGKGV